MNKIQIFIALFIGVCISVAAQSNYKEMRGKRDEIRKKVHAYVKENVFPVIKAQRAKLETALSTEHKNRITELRAEAKPLREQMRSKHQAFRKNHKAGQEPSESERDEMHEIHQKLRKIQLEAWTIADEYDEQMKKLRDEIKPQKETWKTDIKAIIKENIPEEMREKMEERMQKFEEEGGKKHHRHHRGGGFHKGGFGLRKMMTPAHFILLDPNTEMPDLPTDFEGDGAGDEALVFPNPSQNQNAVKFSVQKAGNVKIDLINSGGEIIKTVLNENKSEGEHTIRTDLQNLKTGVYYYQIATLSGTETKRFVIE